MGDAVRVAVSLLDVEPVDLPTRTFAAEFGVKVREEKKSEKGGNPQKEVKENEARTEPPKFSVLNAVGDVDVRDDSWEDSSANSLLAGVDADSPKKKQTKKRRGLAAPVWYRYQRIAATMRAPVDLRRFPFDEQELRIVLRFPRHRSQGIHRIRLDPIAAEMEPDSLSNSEFECVAVRAFVRYAGAKQPSWSPEEVAVDESVLVALDERDVNLKPEIVVALSVRRRPSYWLFSVIVPTLLCTAVGFDVFLMDPVDHHTDRMSLVVTLLLTVVAVRFTLGEKLPNLPYLTFLDRWLLFLFVVLISLAFECAAVFALNDKTSARRVDRACAIFLGFGVICSSALAWTGRGGSQIDSAIFAIGAALAAYIDGEYPLRG
jgi:hypothetical protein